MTDNDDTCENRAKGLTAGERPGPHDEVLVREFFERWLRALKLTDDLAAELRRLGPFTETLLGRAKSESAKGLVRPYVRVINDMAVYVRQAANIPREEGLRTND